MPHEDQTVPQAEDIQPAARDLPDVESRYTPTGRVALVVALLTGLVTHGYNLFRYPLYLTDEGIYTEQAWSVLRQGQLSPYTYFYDHAPMAWIVLAGWYGVLPGQFQSFGNPINAGRVLMVVVHVAGVFLLFEVVRRFSGSTVAAFLATFIFSVSPLAIYYQRQVLLDNLMVFWVLVGLYILARRDGRILTAAGAGAAFGLALVTKENAIFLLPGFAYLMHRGVIGHMNRRFSATFWWFAVLSPVAAYLLFAQTKNELFPAGMDFNLNSPPAGHVSLLYTVWWQLNRTAQGSQGSAFADLLRDSWLPRDRYLLLGGTVAALCALLLGMGDRRRGTPLIGIAVLTIGYGFYLARSVLLDFYVMPLVPLLAMCIGLVYARITRNIKPTAAGLVAAAVIAGPVATPGGYLLKYDQDHRLVAVDQYRVSLTDLQHAQIDWIRANVPPTSRLIIDDDLWVALHDHKPVFENAHSHWKAAADPDVRNNVFHADWQNLDYVVMSNRMRPAMEQNNAGGQEDWILQAIDEHGEKVWQAGKGQVALEIIKIGG